MTGLVLLAVIIDRVGISMRLVGWAAFIVLLLSPDALTGPSFQMSFAAVIALVAVYEVIGNRFRPLVGRSGPSVRVALYLAGIALTSFVAGLATAPFALFHFDRLALYGLAANIVAVPIAALWVMPSAVLALLVMPFGLESAALTVMGWGLSSIVAVAETVAAWPGAVQRIPQLPLAGLLLIVGGGLWLAIWQRKWRFFGAPAIVAGFATAAFALPPDLLISGDGKLMGFRDNATLYVSSARTQPFAREIWQHRTGTRDWKKFGTGLGLNTGSLQCDTLGCFARLRGRKIAFVYDPRALAEDCRAADIVISAVPVRVACGETQLVIDRFDLWRFGAHAIWFDKEGGGRPRVETVNQTRGVRPWVPLRSKATRQ